MKNTKKEEWYGRRKKRGEERKKTIERWRSGKGERRMNEGEGR